ncbi:hypothetical protein [Chromobacterium haemolyticum]|uniref:hypothetical protein n=1 Tax=Chromobacterium haemolyticum TaxID=394935 RepID=UPI0024492DFC|nr:hypothetical protein [Chromobacterium haemolyticum]MDH0340919.1 hypothetical protein [Chromobacterium haemolyticum]
MNAAIGLEVNTPLRLDFAKDLAMRVLRRPEGFWFVAAEVAASMKLEVKDLQQAPLASRWDKPSAWRMRWSRCCACPRVS